jgi:formamidopyrimidine-DNA glycosylase
MPELPEVETVRRGLTERIVGKKILGVEIFHHRATNPRSTKPLETLEGAIVTGVRRRGKFLWFELDRPEFLVAHLGMSGQFRVQRPAIKDELHLRARFTLSTEPGSLAGSDLRFIDQRTFGWLAISPEYEGVPALVGHIAPDIFDPSFDRRSVISIFSGRATPVKALLLEQGVMSGVGNIYADESLWRAKIHPATIGKNLAPKKVGALLDSVSSVMSQALLEGGTSFDSLYINVNGESGYFSRSLMVYGLENEPCSRCGTLIRRITLASRSAHFCPRCQRL